MTTQVCSFEELTAEQAPMAGGKGRTLARLAQAGHPVPRGFIVLTPAFEGDALSAPAWAGVVAGLARLRAAAPA